MDVSPLIEAGAFWINVQAYIQLVNAIGGAVIGIGLGSSVIFLVVWWLTRLFNHVRSR